MITIDAFILYSQTEQAAKTVAQLKQSEHVKNIYLLASEKRLQPIDGCEIIEIDHIQSTQTVERIADKSKANFTLIYQKSTVLQLGYFALERMIKIADDTNAGMVSADYIAITNGEKRNNPVIDYQKGSLRNDFNFGSLMLYNSTALKNAAKRMEKDSYNFAGLYDLRLKVSQKHELVHIN